jgi:general secretion pathway protein F
MAAYAYTAVDPAGKRRRGTSDGASAAAVTRALEEQGLLVLRVEAEREGAQGGSGFGFGRRAEVLEVTRALAALLPAGLPLPRALAATANLASGEVAEALQEIRQRVERGDTLATALGAYPGLFSPLYVGLVRAGERSGNLEGAFARLAEQLEREAELRSRLLSASIYPLVLATVGGLAVVMLLLFVLPRFVEILEGTGAELPGSTAFLLDASTLMRRFWPLLVLLPAGGAAFLAHARGTEGGRRAAAGLLLRLPVVKGVRRYALAARFARLLGVLLGGGAPLVSALEDTEKSLDDPLARDETVRIRTRVREGALLHQAIREGTLFPPLLGQLVAVGEDSGRVQDFLLKAAEMFETRMERVVQRLVTLAEPAMIICFGTFIAFVALSLLQAIYGVNADAFR